MVEFIYISVISFGTINDGILFLEIRLLFKLDAEKYNTYKYIGISTSPQLNNNNNKKISPQIYISK